MDTLPTFREARTAAGYAGREGLERIATRLRFAVSTIQHYDQGNPVKSHFVAKRLSRMLGCSVMVFAVNRAGKTKKAGTGLQSRSGRMQIKAPTV